MRRMALFGTAMALVLTLAIVVPVFGAPPTTIHPPNPSASHRPAPPLAVGTTLTISGSGTAFKIGNRTVTESASISLTATVIKSSPGRGMLNFTAGTLTIGSDTYTVVRGHGIITFHSRLHQFPKQTGPLVVPEDQRRHSNAQVRWGKPLSTPPSSHFC